MTEFCFYLHDPIAAHFLLDKQVSRLKTIICSSVASVASPIASLLEYRGFEPAPMHITRNLLERQKLLPGPHSFSVEKSTNDNSKISFHNIFAKIAITA